MTSRSTTYYQNNREACKLKRKLYDKLRSPEKWLLVFAKRRAKRKHMEFNITLDDIFIPEFCPISGIKLARSTNGVPTDHSPTLDRIDNSIGYVKGNVRVISNRINRRKSDLTKQEIENLWRYVNEH